MRRRLSYLDNNKSMVARQLTETSLPNTNIFLIDFFETVSRRQVSLYLGQIVRFRWGSGMYFLLKSSLYTSLYVLFI